MKIIVKQTVMKEFIDTYEIELTPEDVEHLRESYDSLDDISADVWTELDYELTNLISTEEGDGWEETGYECEWDDEGFSELETLWNKVEVTE
jgi:hypothetical protein